jgi:hypothetical protein
MADAATSFGRELPHVGGEVHEPRRG